MIKILLLLSGGIALFFVGKSGVELWRYMRLDSAAAIQTIQWSVRERSESACLLQASYTYEVQGTHLTGKTLFKEPVYLNLPSAKRALSEWEGASWHVWYQASCPQQSSLQKMFPFKSAVHALLTLGVFCYFWVISRRACKVVV